MKYGCMMQRVKRLSAICNKLISHSDVVVMLLYGLIMFDDAIHFLGKKLKELDWYELSYNPTAILILG